MLAFFFCGSGLCLGGVSWVVVGCRSVGLTTDPCFARRSGLTRSRGVVTSRRAALDTRCGSLQKCYATPPSGAQRRAACRGTARGAGVAGVSAGSWRPQLARDARIAAGRRAGRRSLAAKVRTSAAPANYSATESSHARAPLFAAGSPMRPGSGVPRAGLTCPCCPAPRAAWTVSVSGARPDGFRAERCRA